MAAPVLLQEQPRGHSYWACTIGSGPLARGASNPGPKVIELIGALKAKDTLRLASQAPLSQERSKLFVLTINNSYYVFCDEQFAYVSHVILTTSP